MKTTPVQPGSICRSVPSWTAAFLAACMCVGSLSAQAGSSGTGTSGTGSSTGTTGSATGSARGTERDATSTARADDDASLKRSDRRFITKAAEDNHKEIAISQLAAQRASNPEVRSYAQQIASEHQKMTQELVQLAQRKGVTLDDVTALTSSGAMAASTQSSMDTNRSMSGGGVGESTNAGVAAEHGAPRATGSSGTASTPASTGIATNESTATSNRDASGMAGDMTSDRHYRNLSRKQGAEFDKSYVDMMVDQHEDDVKLFERAAKNAEDPEVRSFASRHLSSLQAHLDHAKNLMKTTAAAE